MIKQRLKKLYMLVLLLVAGSAIPTYADVDNPHRYVCFEDQNLTPERNYIEFRYADYQDKGREDAIKDVEISVEIKNVGKFLLGRMSRCHDELQLYNTKYGVLQVWGTSMGDGNKDKWGNTWVRTVYMRYYPSSEAFPNIGAMELKARWDIDDDGDKGDDHMISEYAYLSKVNFFQGMGSISSTSYGRPASNSISYTVYTTGRAVNGFEQRVLFHPGGERNMGSSDSLSGTLDGTYSCFKKEDISAQLYWHKVQSVRNGSYGSKNGEYNTVEQHFWGGVNKNTLLAMPNLGAGTVSRNPDSFKATLSWNITNANVSVIPLTVYRRLDGSSVSSRERIGQVNSNARSFTEPSIPEDADKDYIYELVYENSSWRESAGSETIRLTISAPSISSLWGGTGTAESPYLIKNEADLRRLSKYAELYSPNTAGKYWKQTADIDLGGEARPWTSIGKNAYFRGSYNGGGFTVSNIHIADDDLYSGFFGNVSGYDLPEVPVIENIRLKAVNVNGKNSVNAGVLAASLNKVIVRNCYVEGSVSGKDGVGGLAGDCYVSTVENCAFVGTVSGVNNVSGFANSSSNISRSTYTGCYTAATVTATGSQCIGVFDGGSYPGTYTNCYYDSTLAGSMKGVGTEGSTQSFDVGGLAPKATDDFARGQAAWLLNGSKAENPTWYQTLGTDTYPLLDKTHKVVSEWDEGYYSNDPRPWTEGNGTAETPYLISNEAQLRALATYTNNGGKTAGKFWKQTADIDLGGEARPWTPIGTDKMKFGGNYNGGGFTVSNMYVSASRDAGFFGSTSAYGLPERQIFENIILKNVNINNSGTYSAGLAARTDETKVRNCYVTGTVSGQMLTGGFIGDLIYTTVYNCGFDGTVSGTDYVGGFAVSGFSSLIMSSYVSAAVSGTGTKNIGAFYSKQDGMFDNCYYNSTVAGDAKGAGFENTTESADVNNITPKTAEEFASGEVTWLLNGSKAENPSWYQTLGTDKLPLLDATHKVVSEWGEGYYSNDPIPWEGEGTTYAPYLISNEAQLRALAIYTNGGGKTAGKFWKQTADIDLGGEARPWFPIGLSSYGMEKFSFNGSYNGGGFTVKNIYLAAGSANSGFFGYISGFKLPEQDQPMIENIRLYNAVVSSTDYLTGTLAGSAGNATIRSCYAEGTVRGSYAVGGLLGMSGVVTLENCGFVGTASGDDSVGGLVGTFDRTSNVSNCYAAATVAVNPTPTGPECIGAFCGGKRGTYTNCYYDSSLNEAMKGVGVAGSLESNDIEGITPKTTEQFKSGEVTWLLNGSQSEYPVWYQTLGTDTYPLLDDTHKTVYFWGNSYHNDLFPWTEGDGTKEAPYIISNEAQLRALAAWTNGGGETAGKFWKQTADIDLGGEARPWTSIGERYIIFKGNYNGGGFTVSNMYANGRDGHLGFFSSVSGYQLPEKPVIENIRLKGATVLADGHYAGTLAGTLNIAVVRNCYAEGNVSGDSYVGGLAGNLSESTFENCGFAGTVNGKDYVGGFGFGNGDFNIFTNCYAAATVNATDPLFIGAFSGNELGTFTNCYYDSTLAGTMKGVGAEGSTEGKDIAGVTPKTTDKFKSGEVTWLLNGSQSETPVWYQTLGEDAYPLLDATHKVILFWGNSYHNDPFPWTEGDGTKEVPYIISNEAQLRALAAWTNGGGETAGKFWKQTADIDLGGEARPWTPIGTEEIMFKGSYNGGGFTISNMHINASFYAGLFGKMDGAELPEQPVIENIRLKSASVKGKDVYYVGALVGEADEVTIRNCYIEGTVSGHEGIGGLAGCLTLVTLENCGFAGTVEGIRWVGGLVGQANLTNDITNCYAAATVNGESEFGAFVGFPGGSVYTNCYYDSSLNIGLEAGVWGAVEGVTPKTSLEGTALAAELGITNWNFTGGVLPIQKVFEPENAYDITFDDSFNHDDITADIANATVRVMKSETETWATVQLPFALTEIQLADWGTFYEFTGYDAVSNKAKFKEVTSVVPHASYLWKRTANSEYWKAEGVTVKRTDRIEVIEPMEAMPEGLVGTDYYKIRVGENNDYQLRDIFTGNVEDCHFAPYASLDERAFPFSAVLYIMGEPKERVEIEMTDRNGITTGIMQVEIDYSNGTYEVYDLYGRRLPKPVQGFNIINGQKVYIK